MPDIFSLAPLWCHGFTYPEVDAGGASLGVVVGSDVGVGEWAGVGEGMGDGDGLGEGVGVGVGMALGS